MQFVRVDAGDASRGRVISRAAQDLRRLVHGDLALRLVQQADRVLADDARESARLVQVDLPARHARRLRDAEALQGARVSHRDVAADARRDDRVLRGDGVQVLPGGHAPVGESVLVPAVGVDDLARGDVVLLDEAAAERLHLLDGVGVLELHLAQRHAEVEQVHVAVAKAGVDRRAVQVHALRLLAPEHEDGLVVAQGVDLAVQYGHGRLRKEAVQPAQARVIENQLHVVHQKILPQSVMVSRRSLR